MTNPSEICTITADGQKYDIWESVEVHRGTEAATGTINHALMTVAELSDTSGKFKGFSDLKLTCGDQVSISLAGIKIIDGAVYLRQAAYDDKTHAVQIGVYSKTEAVTRTTVDVNPGSYTNQTIKQIASATFGKVGVGFKVMGSPAGSELKFVRACEQLGESRYNFVERLCRLVNLHLLDDGKGNMLAFRGTQGNVSAPLQEGVNILRARLLLQVDEHVPDLEGVTQMNNPSSGKEGAQQSYSTTVQTPFKAQSGKVKFAAEDVTQKAMLPHRVNHQADYDAMKTVDGMITVQGWFAPDGDLWWNKVAQSITVNSPMLIPEGSMSFAIKEVIHRQGPEGTTTDIMITNPLGLGGPALANVDNPSG